MSEAEAMEKLCDHIPAIKQWCDKFLHSEPLQGLGNIDFKRYVRMYVLANVTVFIFITPMMIARPGDSAGDSCVCVTEVMDIEENIWSPRYVQSKCER